MSLLQAGPTANQPVLFLQSGTGLVISDNTVDGKGAEMSRGILSRPNRAVEATIDGNVVTNVTSGIVANRLAQFTVSGNTVSNTTGGVVASSDEATIITGNVLTGNNGALPFGRGSSATTTVEDNTFANNPTHVVDLAPGDYDLEGILAANTFPAGAAVSGNAIRGG